MSLTVFGMVLPWVLVAVGCWLVLQMLRQNGRMLLRLEALEAGLRKLGGRDQPASGLPVGSAAPEFELPDLEGNASKLTDFRGKRVLLIFFNPQCGFCAQMADDLAALDPDGKDGRPVPLVVSAGDAGLNRDLAQEHQIRCPVLLQKANEVASSYQASGTPSGYLIDKHGKLASGLAVGAGALLDLAAETGEEPQGGQAGQGKANHGLAASRIKRDGLAAGTPAPAFRLPRLDGGELALEDYRGRRVLLVFSDPECGPCEELALRLQDVHRRRPDVQVVMVSRRDPELNRQKVGRLGLSFPVVLQKQWEISRQYAMFATPVGYLIDEHGVISADVAVGLEAVLGLASEATLPPAELANGQARKPEGEWVYAGAAGT